MQAPLSQRNAIVVTYAIVGGSLGVGFFFFTHYPDGMAGWYSIAVGVVAIAIYISLEYFLSE